MICCSVLMWAALSELTHLDNGNKWYSLLLIFLMLLVWLHLSLVNQQYLDSGDGVLVMCQPTTILFHCCSPKDVPSGCLELDGGSALDSPCCH